MTFWRPVIAAFLLMAIGLSSAKSAPLEYQVEISPSCRVRNTTNRCLWASIETLALKNKVKELYGVHRDEMNYPAGIQVTDLEQHLRAKRIPHRIQHRGNFDKTILDIGCRQHRRGVAFGMLYYKQTPKGLKQFAHMAVAIHYDETGVYFICPSRPDRIQFAYNEWFDHYWDGSAVVIYPRPEE